MSIAVQESLRRIQHDIQVLVPSDEAYPLVDFVTTVAQTVKIPDEFDKNQFTYESPLFVAEDFQRATSDGKELIRRFEVEGLPPDVINGVLEAMAILMSRPTKNGLPIWSFGMIETFASAQEELRRRYPEINIHCVIGENEYAPRNHPDLPDNIRQQFGFDHHLTRGGLYAGVSGVIFPHRNGSPSEGHIG